VLAGKGEQLGTIAALPDDLEAGALQQARQPLAEQHVVLGEDHPCPGHGPIMGYRPFSGQLHRRPARP